VPEADSVYAQKGPGEYSDLDFIQFYEEVRFSTPFMVYRKMAWWPWIDFFALYGHLINNMIIVCLAIYVNVSVVMFFNLLCMCLLYMTTTRAIHGYTGNLRKRTGLLTQCDLKMAQMITKRYKKTT